MGNVLIYSIGKMLYFHSHHIIKKGIIQLIDSTGIIIEEYPVHHTEFICHQLKVHPGKYLAIFKCKGAEIEKKLTIY